PMTTTSYWYVLLMAVSFRSVGPRQTQGGLCDEVEDHLAAHGRGAHESRDEPEVREPVLAGQAVAAVGLDRLVQSLEGRFRGEELGDVGRLTDAGVSLVEEAGAVLRREPAGLDLHVGEGDRVRDAL